jgi:hypothetical protein
MMKRATLSVFLIALAVIGSSSEAHAEVDAGPGPGPGPGPGTVRAWAPASPHVNTGLEILGGAEAWSFASRTHVGLSIPLGYRGRIRPTIGFGGTFALGSLEVEDPRALSGRVSIGYYEVGPEARIGLRWVDGGIVDPQVFASFAYLRTTLDERLMLDAVEGVEGTRGMRAAVGINWVQPLMRAAANGDGTKDVDLSRLMLLLVPHQAELSWERSCGSERVGLTLSYGL